MKAVEPIDIRILFERIQGDDPEEQAKGAEMLYRLIRKVSGHYLRGRLGADGEAVLHDLYIAVLKAIRAEQVRVPGSLRHYIWGAALNQYHLEIDRRMALRRRLVLLSGSSDEDQDPLRQTPVMSPTDRRAIGRACAKNNVAHGLLEAQERTGQLRSGLKALNAQDREILSRFYLRDDELTATERKLKIRAIMHLTETQFRLIKSRAKDRLSHTIHLKRDKLIVISKRLRSLDSPVSMAA